MLQKGSPEIEMGVTRTIRAALARALPHCLDAFFPPVCASCARRCERSGFCAACRAAIAAPRTPMCPRCGQPFAAGVDHLCSACAQHPPPYDRARACTTYARGRDSPLAQTLHHFKYGRDVSLVSALADLIAPPFAIDHDVLAVVPLHMRRLRWRGFNQAALLIAPLARRTGVPFDPRLLVRLRDTRAQVGLEARERSRNIRNAFALRAEGSVKDRRVLLFDDVLTTGATAAECARTLRRGGAAAVDVLVLARVL